MSSQHQYDTFTFLRPTHGVTNLDCTHARTAVNQRENILYMYTYKPANTSGRVNRTGQDNKPSGMVVAYSTWFRASLTCALLLCSSFRTNCTFFWVVREASMALWLRQASLALSYESLAVISFIHEFPTRCQLSPQIFSEVEKPQCGFIIQKWYVMFSIG